MKKQAKKKAKKLLDKLILTAAQLGYTVDKTFIQNGCEECGIVYYVESDTHKLGIRLNGAIILRSRSTGWEFELK